MRRGQESPTDKSLKRQAREPRSRRKALLPCVGYFHDAGVTRCKSCAFTVKIPSIRVTNRKFQAGKRHIAAATFPTPSWLRSVADFSPSTLLGFGSKIRRFWNIPFPCPYKQSDYEKISPNTSIVKGRRGSEMPLVGFVYFSCLVLSTFLSPLASFLSPPPLITLLPCVVYFHGAGMTQCDSCSLMWASVKEPWVF